MDMNPGLFATNRRLSPALAMTTGLVNPSAKGTRIPGFRAFEKKGAANSSTDSQPLFRVFNARWVLIFY